MIYVVDPSPLNWLFVLFNTMEEVVRANREGRIVPSLASSWNWIDETILEFELRKDVVYHNGQLFSSEDVDRNYDQVKPWIAPHPPGTWLNLPDGTELEVVDEYIVRFHFPKPHGLAIGQLRAYHLGNLLFWQRLGFGYAKLGTAEGHW